MRKASAEPCKHLRCALVVAGDGCKAGVRTLLPARSTGQRPQLWAEAEARPVRNVPGVSCTPHPAWGTRLMGSITPETCGFS